MQTNVFSSHRLLEMYNSLVVLDEHVLPLTTRNISDMHNNVFGGAILKRGNRTDKNDGDIVVATGTNKYRSNPLYHGEIVALNAFFEMTDGIPANPDDYYFVASHQPCLMCMAALYWAGFKDVYYVFDYDETASLFFMPDDRQMVNEFTDNMLNTQNKMINMMKIGNELSQNVAVCDEELYNNIMFLECAVKNEEVRQKYINLAPSIISNILYKDAVDRCEEVTTH